MSLTAWISVEGASQLLQACQALDVRGIEHHLHGGRNDDVLHSESSRQRHCNMSGFDVVAFRYHAEGATHLVNGVADVAFVIRHGPDEERAIAATARDVPRSGRGSSEAVRRGGAAGGGRVARGAGVGEPRAGSLPLVFGH